MQALLQKLEGDRNIWFIVFSLSLFSILAVYSATGSLAFNQQSGNTEHYLVKQIMLVGFAFCLMYAAHLRSDLYYSGVAKMILYISISLLIYRVLFGTDINDARRWLTVPVLDITFQTSDLAKLALIMYTARMLSKKQHIIKDFDKAFVPIAAPMITICMLIVPADLSSAILLFITCTILMFIGRVSLRHIGLTIWLGLTAFLLYVGFLAIMPDEGRVGTWKSRIESFMDREEKALPDQVKYAKVAMANGGIVRLAPGKSIQRNFLPHPYSDFIYAIIIEEYGLLGGIIVTFLYLGFLYRCIKIFIKSPGAFGAFLAVGLGISLVLQALMNMAVTVNLLPVTGLTLPLVSMGGTSLLFTSIAIGIILSVSRDIDKTS